MEKNKEIQAVDSTAVNIEKANEQMNAMIQYADKWLKKGTDYAVIAGGTKPSLLKSGAEKMNILMGLRPKYEIISEVKNKEDCYYYVQVKCELINKNGELVANCIGSCNNKEKARMNVPFYDSFNPVLKMAEKRAFVGATLHANALSQMYTQDMEDMPTDRDGICEDCGIVVNNKVSEYSKTHFNGKIKCVACQKKVKEQKK